MSRSFKRPWVKGTSRSGQRWMKRYASKVVRRYRSYIPDGMRYKRIFETWDLCDYRWMVYKREVESDQSLHFPWYRYIMK